MKKIQRKKNGKASASSTDIVGGELGEGSLHPRISSSSRRRRRSRRPSSSVVVEPHEGFPLPLFCVPSAVVAKMLSLCRRRRRRIMPEEEEQQQQQEAEKKRGRLVAQGEGSC